MYELHRKFGVKAAEAALAEMVSNANPSKVHTVRILLFT